MAYIEKPENVSGNARVSDNAIVYGNARVSGHAQVYGSACVYGTARVFDNACVYGSASVTGSACVSDNAYVYGNASVYGYAYITGEADISCNADWFSLIYNGQTLTGYKSRNELGYELNIDGRNIKLSELDALVIPFITSLIAKFSKTETPAKELTVKEIEALLGYNVKIVK